MNKLINSINISDCVGDSLGKINFNTLSLDTTICNISSKFFNDPNINLYFSDLSENIDNFNEFANYFEYPTEVNLATTATKYLSSFWNTPEITFTFPINVHQTDGYITSYVDSKFENETLWSFGLNRLRRLYDTKNFPENFTANVIFLLYSNNVGEKSITIEKESINTNSRVFEIKVRKNDVFIDLIKIAKYNIDPVTKRWTFLKTIV
jgi:hypothetical protein